MSFDFTGWNVPAPTCRVTSSISIFFVINSLNEWAEQCVMEPSVENEYSYLEAFELAKKTNLNLIDEQLLDKLIYYDTTM